MSDWRAFGACAGANSIEQAELEDILARARRLFSSIRDIESMWRPAPDLGRGWRMTHTSDELWAWTTEHDGGLCWHVEAGVLGLDVASDDGELHWVEFVV